MARTLGKLTDITARSAKLKKGRHSDGGGLYLNVSSTGSKSWLFMWVVDGKRREMGMGPYPAVSLAAARAKGAECRAAVKAGRDPIAERNREAEPTFGECADKFLASMQSHWRNEKHRAQWKMTLDEYAASLRSKPVSTVDTTAVLAVLTPIWTTKPETASRLRGRVERVKLDEFTVHGFRSSFRDWCGDATSFSRELAEQALAHAVGDETERAYRRSDALEARRPLTGAWSAYCDKPAASNVLRLRG